MSGSHTVILYEPISRFSAKLENGSSPSIIIDQKCHSCITQLYIHSNVHVRTAFANPGATYYKYEQKFYEQNFPTTFYKPNLN